MVHFGQVYLMFLIVVKDFLILGKVDLCGGSYEVRFKPPTTNYVYWRNFWIFPYWFVHLLRALSTFSFGKVLLFFII